MKEINIFLEKAKILQYEKDSIHVGIDFTLDRIIHKINTENKIDKLDIKLLEQIESVLNRIRGICVWEK